MSTEDKSMSNRDKSLVFLLLALGAAIVGFDVFRFGTLLSFAFQMAGIIFICLFVVFLCSNRD